MLKFNKGVPDSEFSVEFAQGMLDRMSMSYFKYGLVSEAYPSKIDAIKSLHQRLNKYAETGNTEWLMDAANFAMIEYMYPKHDKAHWKATDTHESPGRTWANEQVTDASNTSGRDNMRLGGSDLHTAGGHYKNEGD